MDVSAVDVSAVASARWFGDRAVMIDFASARDRAAFSTHAAAFTEHLVGSPVGYEVRYGVATALVEAPEVDPGLLDAVRAVLASLAARAQADDPRVGDRARTVVLPVDYCGPDLASAAQALGLTEAEVVRAHIEQRWRVAFLGFAPGFGYLEPVGASTAAWQRVPRRPSPRARVPAGSVAVAAGHSAVYPKDMPGGWVLIGITDAPLFDPGRSGDPTLLHPGDDVRFEAT